MTDAARLAALQRHIQTLGDMQSQRAAKLFDRGLTDSELFARYTRDASFVALAAAKLALQLQADEVSDYIAARADTGFRDYVIRSAA